ncbi:DUF2147 domain-containing protein [Desulfospira joergensenii]|uniref:DUF2147 domain-containing protein n=1 Tax=Desulfospira joergensenii TaxID=53329 RepID=UPI0003B355E4|nr:DUF2147 domain-containing protein [Desulfospira joergensenii]
MKKMFKLCVYLVLFSFCIICSASAKAPVEGKWKTIDDETNEPKSIVEIFEKDGKFYGKVVKLFRKPGEDPHPTCSKCPDDDPRKDQPTLGMEVIKGLEPDGDTYSGGTILDPKKGKIYACKIWVEEDKLKVRGSILFFYRTQTWHRME